MPHYPDLADKVVLVTGAGSGIGEYAARAETQTTRYWGDGIGRNNANCHKCGSRWGNRQTAPVGSFQPNTFGLHDMSGNVAEWTCSQYKASYDGSEQKCAASASRYTLRGGSWDFRPRYVRSAYRDPGVPGYRGSLLGFRLARDIELTEEETEAERKRQEAERKRQEELAALKQKQAAKLKNKKTRLRNQEIKIGIILGFTGPIDHLTPDMGTAADMAFQEASESSLLLGGQKVEAIRADSTCLDSSAATLAADRLVNLDKVVAILGADCSGVTTAIANNVGIPYGITMISPSATSPVLSKIADNGYFFRTAPSDARQGQLLAEIAIRRLIKQVAVTYTNNKYGRLLADSFSSTYKKLGGEVTAMVPHEDGKVDYSTEVTSLDATGADVLAVFGYVDKGGRHIIQESLDSDAFDKFILTDGMYGESLIKHVDGDLTGTFGISPGTDSEKADIFAAMAKSAGIGNAYTGESYDAAALLILAIQSAWSTDSTAIASNVMRVANAPGEKILPGELTKGLRLIARGEAVDYVGATNVELIGSGEAKGSFEEFEISNKMFITIRFH